MVKTTSTSYNFVASFLTARPCARFSLRFLLGESEPKTKRNKSRRRCVKSSPSTFRSLESRRAAPDLKGVRGSTSYNKGALNASVMPEFFSAKSFSLTLSRLFSLVFFRKLRSAFSRLARTVLIVRTLAMHLSDSIQISRLTVDFLRYLRDFSDVRNFKRLRMDGTGGNIENVARLWR